MHSGISGRGLEMTAEVHVGDIVRVRGDCQAERMWRVFSLYCGKACLELASGQSMVNLRWADEMDLVRVEWGAE